MTNFNN